MIPVLIWSGGQTGVDRAALDYAMRAGLRYGGWCPRGGWAEDCPSPPGVLAAYPRLIETPSAVPEQRTAWNVRDSHATLILTWGRDRVCSPGTVFARQAAELIFLRPWLEVDMLRPDAVDAARAWLARTATGLGIEEWVLNVAGPRESQCPGIHAEALRFLTRWLGDSASADNSPCR